MNLWRPDKKVSLQKDQEHTSTASALHHITGGVYSAVGVKQAWTMVNGVRHLPQAHEAQSIFLLTPVALWLGRALLNWSCLYFKFCYLVHCSCVHSFLFNYCQKLLPMWITEFWGAPLNPALEVSTSSSGTVVCSVEKSAQAPWRLCCPTLLCGRTERSKHSSSGVKQKLSEWP